MSILALYTTSHSEYLLIFVYFTIRSEQKCLLRLIQFRNRASAPVVANSNVTFTRHISARKLLLQSFTAPVTILEQGAPQSQTFVAMHLRS